MAHAYKKTLLAQLGFADADKQNPKHDLAVEYLALPHNSRRLIQGFYKTMTWDLQTTPKEPYGPPERDPDGWRWSTRQLSNLSPPERERPITKGEERFKTTVGFLDLFLQFLESNNKWIQASGQDTEVRRDYDEHDEKQIIVRGIVIEVKAQPLATGDLLRQMKLYREHADCLRLGLVNLRWVVAGCFKFTETQAAALRQEKFTPISLGPLCDEWAETKRNDRTLATNVEEF